MKNHLIISILVFIICTSVLIVESDELHRQEKSQSEDKQSINYYINATDVPTWSIGDSWEYTADIYSDTDNGTFDLSSQDLTITVNDIADFQKYDIIYDTYHLLITGTVTGTFQASIISGDVTGVIDGEAYVRRADLSILYSNISSYGIISVLILNYDYEIKNTNEYLIPLEYFDFPIVPYEQWNMSTHTTLNSSIYVEDFIDDSSSEMLISNGTVQCIEKVPLSTPIGSLETYHLLSEENGSIETWYAEDIKSIAKAVIIKIDEDGTNTIFLNISQYTIIPHQIVINQTITPYPSPILDTAVIQGFVFVQGSSTPVTNTLVNISIPAYDLIQETSTDAYGLYSIDVFVESFHDNTHTAYDLGSDGIITTVLSTPQSSMVSTLIAVDNFSQVCPLDTGWNFISIPFNQSIHPEELFIKFSSSYLSWSEATSNQNPTGYPIINSYLFEWNRTTQSYGFVSTLRSGQGYWLYAAQECVLSSKQESNDQQISITLLDENWNAIGLPQTQEINKDDMIIVINSTNYDWDEAVMLSYVSDYVFYWNSTAQTYGFTNLFEPGSAYWVYSFQQCLLIH